MGNKYTGCLPFLEKIQDGGFPSRSFRGHMHFNELGRFPSTRKINDAPTHEVAVIQEVRSGDYGICLYPFGAELTPRDAAVMRMTREELRKLRDLLNNVLGDE